MKTKRPNKTALKNKADRLFSLIVRKRDKVCQRCGTADDLQCAHGFTRGYVSTRWDEQNAWALCRGCHLFYTHRPIEWADFMIDAMGEEAYDALRLKARDIRIRPDLEATVDALDERLKELEDR